MKKAYVKPIIVNNIRENGIIPLAAVAAVAEVGGALLAGYAAGKAVSNIMKARPMRKLQTLQTIGEAI